LRDQLYTASVLVSKGWAGAGGPSIGSDHAPSPQHRFSFPGVPLDADRATIVEYDYLREFFRDPLAYLQFAPQSLADFLG
jgi:hypothetical protein